MLVGSVAANAGNSSQPQSTVIYQQPSQNVDYQARADAEAARRSAEMALMQQQQQQQQQRPPPPGLAMVKVRIPLGVRPGQTFTFEMMGHTFRTTCPEGYSSGQDMYTYVPLAQEQASNIADAADVSSVGRQVLREALASPSKSHCRAILVKDHIVDESRLEFSEHGIISAKQDDIVEIMDGTLESGLPPPYEEYCLVKIISTGRIGKVSRFLLRPLPSSAASTIPPRALKE
jgi:hypothetical protein